MGFLDKAKKLAEQAQSKLDEVQGQFNQQAGAKPSGPDGTVVEHDKHGRSTPPPPAASAPTPPAPPPPPAASAPPSPPAPVEEDRNHPSYAPPKLTSGDPLAA